MKINIGPYIIDHYMSPPSKSSDYDYDPDNPYRRFISIFMHHLVFIDYITNQELLHIIFSSDIAESISYGILSMFDNLGVDNNDIISKKITTTINDIFIQGIVDKHVVLILNRLENGRVLFNIELVSYCANNNTIFSMSLDERSAETLYNELENRDVFENLKRNFYYTI